MRIISGKNKGKHLIAPAKLPVRPTTDFAKEALFNILNNNYYFDEISVLDLFAGTGNISYEFASRGSQNIISVDSHSGCVQFITKTAKELEYSITTFKSDVYSYLKKTNQKFDVIFADPPYDFTQEKFAEIVDLVFDRNLLNEGGVLIIEHSKQTDLEDVSNFSYSKKYGGNLFSFFELES
ncbi:RsmD family RNA methyltransferase [Capnocytophaga stomatis]|uniref:16S rRNA (Guanine(966)-N(2))-methyltransferase RsmD n=1 Tax=Capnocytophaga stomatis TaxID=1848904 RepID=A0A250FT32_9FLAO|nr:RsmD family RNA methyltransferase [Capnocytophaga stomatis]ATA88290.1 16S rRNA (guanine(966)-N(2))-methyltransferase RsmD [Capnocytophaga stomatis]GIJ92964.1 methyltransferase [Capnocytophaga stomatis]GIJ96328.1 methyltransferase [Capnocytophaga stomatis]